MTIEWWWATGDLLGWGRDGTARIKKDGPISIDVFFLFYFCVFWCVFGYEIIAARREFVIFVFFAVQSVTRSPNCRCSILCWVSTVNDWQPQEPCIFFLAISRWISQLARGWKQERLPGIAGRGRKRRQSPCRRHTELGNGEKRGGGGS